MYGHSAWWAARQAASFGRASAAAGTVLALTTHRSRPRFSQRATGLPWNLTFADAIEKVRGGESGRSRVAIADLG